MQIDRPAAKVSSKPLRWSFRIQDHYDLAALSALALALPLLLILPVPLVRVPLGLAMILFAPGYALLSALFPRRGEHDLPAKLGLSFGLSLAALPLLALVLDALPWGIRPGPIAISLAVWIVGWDSVALVRRWQLTPAGLADVAAPPNVGGWWRGTSARAKLGYAFGALALAGVLAGGVRVMLAPDPTARMTEFYALGQDGLAEGYPREARPGETMQVQLGITNREESDASYRVEARAGDQVLARLGPVSVAAGASWRAPLSYSLPRAGDDQTIDILLFRDQETTPYRSLRLWVNIRGTPL